MSAELEKDGRMLFIFPESLEHYKANTGHAPEIEQAIKNVEWLQRQKDDSLIKKITKKLRKKK